MDVLMITPRSQDLAYQKRLVEFLPYLNGEGITWYTDEGVIACGGVILTTQKDVAELWILCDVVIPHYKKILLEESLNFVNRLLVDGKYCRLQAITECCNIKAQEYVEHLGLTIEGRLRNYGGMGNDYFMYSRVE